MQIMPLQIGGLVLTLIDGWNRGVLTPIFHMGVPWRRQRQVAGMESTSPRIIMVEDLLRSSGKLKDLRATKLNSRGG